MTQADGTHHDGGKGQAKGLTTPIADERALAYLSAREVNGYPAGCSGRLDLHSLGVCKTPSMQLAPNLSRKRLPLAFFAPAKMMAARHVWRHRFPASRALAIETRWCRDVAVKGDQPYLPLVGARTRSGP